MAKDTIPRTIQASVTENSKLAAVRITKRLKKKRYDTQYHRFRNLKADILSIQTLIGFIN